MPRLLLTVKTITPLLMYGADNKKPNAQPELRAPSVRGILRYWLRAVLGQKDQDPENLYKAESRILGSTSQVSQISVRVMPSRSLVEAGDVRVLPERLSHVGYEPEGEFRMVFSTHPLASEDLLTGDFLKAVYLMMQLGGLGKRARRGSGNLRVLNASGVNETLGNYSLDYLAADCSDLKRFLEVITSEIGSKSIGNTPPQFPTFAKNTAVVLLGKETEYSYEEAFNKLWKISGSYHHEGGVFGDVRPRRASAIHMRVSETKAGYVPLMTIFYAGRGKWNTMQDFIQHCRVNGFEDIYGDWSSW